MTDFLSSQQHVTLMLLVTVLISIVVFLSKVLKLSNDPERVIIAEGEYLFIRRRYFERLLGLKGVKIKKSQVSKVLLAKFEIHTADECISIFSYEDNALDIWVSNGAAKKLVIMLKEQCPDAIVVKIET
ncbi:hypothetical protein MD588_07900 [Photobacterium sp. SDRW27]|uniref:hypothetical protein n=1 Tax=Photobacterium obscurum TaxID=2829490 RepID=UPI002243C148|nr:hypothetical protein [Photobacterium obscurum]MCW8328730.1 hypothetical protein [Photobacterium obscurum]